VKRLVFVAATLSRRHFGVAFPKSACFIGVSCACTLGNLNVHWLFQSQKEDAAASGAGVDLLLGVSCFVQFARGPEHGLPKSVALKAPALPHALDEPRAIGPVVSEFFGKLPRPWR
jgi:hypothetical protein